MTQQVTTNLSNSNIKCTNIDVRASTSSYTTSEIKNASSGSNTYDITITLSIDAILDTLGATIDNIKLSYKIYGLNGIAQAAGANGTVMTGYKDSNNVIQYEEGNKHVKDIGKGSSSASSYADTISSPEILSDGNVVLCMHIENPIAAAKNQFTISNLSIEINFTPAPYKVKLNAINAINGDTVCLLAADGSSLNATEYEFQLGDQFSYYVKTCDGRTIKAISAYCNGVDEGVSKPDFSASLNEQENIFQLDVTVFLDMCGKTIELYITLNNPCVAKISTVNGTAYDKYYLMSMDETVNYGTEYVVPLQSDGCLFYALATGGRKITGIDLYLDNKYSTTWNYATLVSHNWLSSDCRILKLKYTEITPIAENDTMEIVVYFEGNPYAVYVGQTQALRVYVGATEVLNIV